jgi:hypothetical protein
MPGGKASHQYRPQAPHAAVPEGANSISDDRHQPPGLLERHSRAVYVEGWEGREGTTCRMSGDGEAEDILYSTRTAVYDQGVFLLFGLLVDSTGEEGS